MDLKRLRVMCLAAVLGGCASAPATPPTVADSSTVKKTCPANTGSRIPSKSSASGRCTSQDSANGLARPGGTGVREGPSVTGSSNPR